MINDILDYNLITLKSNLVLQFQEFPLHFIMKDLAKLYEPQLADKKIKLQIEFKRSEDSDLCICTDFLRLKSVFVNILGNFIIV